MEFTSVKKQQWSEIKEIYMEAFPKCERKPFFLLRQSIKRKKAVLAVAAEGNQLLGFTVFVVYKDMVMIDYLAVSSKIRSRGTGSRILEHICGQFSDKKIVLLIERVDDMAENCQQRTARRRFYLKNGFTSSGIFITGAGGDMEVLNYGELFRRRNIWIYKDMRLGSCFSVCRGFSWQRCEYLFMMQEGCF